MPIGAAPVHVQTPTVVGGPCGGPGLAPPLNSNIVAVPSSDGSRMSTFAERCGSCKVCVRETEYEHLINQVSEKERQQSNGRSELLIVSDKRPELLRADSVCSPMFPVLHVLVVLETECARMSDLLFAKVQDLSVAKAVAVFGRETAIADDDVTEVASQDLNSFVRQTMLSCLIFWYAVVAGLKLKMYDWEKNPFCACECTAVCVETPVCFSCWRDSL